MTTPTLVILGAGEDQLPAYLEGRRLGYRIVGVDQRSDSLGGAFSDEFLQVTTRDADAVAVRLGRREVAGFLSPASDAAQATVASLNRQYGCPHVPSEKAVRASQNKGYFREVLAELGYPQPDFFQSRDRAALLRRAARMRLPLVVKPADSSGSKGLQLCVTAAEIPDAVASAERWSVSGNVILEEFLTGRHFSVEGFFRDGRAALSVTTERELAGPRNMISGGHLLPAPLPTEIADRLHRMCTSVLAALDHRDGPVNIDFVLTEDGEIYLIELGARLGGNGMPMLMRHAYGVNTVAAAIQLTVGEPVELVPRAVPNHVILRVLQAPHAGVLRRVAGLAQARAAPGILECQVYKRPGERVEPYTQASHKLGYLVAVAEDRSSVVAAAEVALKSLDIEVSMDEREVG